MFLLTVSWSDLGLAKKCFDLQNIDLLTRGSYIYQILPLSDVNTHVQIDMYVCMYI